MVQERRGSARPEEESGQGMKRIVASRGLAILIAALVAADWLSKLWITNRLALGETDGLDTSAKARWPLDSADMRRRNAA